MPVYAFQPSQMEKEHAAMWSVLSQLVKAWEGDDKYEARMDTLMPVAKGITDRIWKRRLKQLRKEDK